jgi:serine/threonine protein kinase
MSYREKYIKYKNKYLILKNNFLGAGENGRIEFFIALKSNLLEKTKIQVTIDSSQVSNDVYKQFLNSLKSIIENSTELLFIILTKDDGTRIEFQIEKYLSEGTNGMVFKTIDNKIIKISLNKNSRLNYEGKITEELEIEPVMKALYQGNEEISFVIYNYLGEPTQDVIKKRNDLGFLFHIFNNLFIQIDKLNSRGYFHNDIKIANSVIIENNIYLIDFELTQTISFIGSYESLCLFGCVNNIFNNFRYKYDELKINEIVQYFNNTDIVAFFNFLIDCFFIHYKINTNTFNLINSLLILDRIFSLNDIIKMMCF